jgi:hypothetical protein
MKGKATTPLVTSRHAVLLFFTSASVLAYEILLMRLLSISFWTHFAAMAISLALLGFGASGSFLFLLSRRIYRNMDGWLVFLAGGAALSFPLSFSLAKEIGLDPLNLVWQHTEWVKMLWTYLVMAVPFLLSGGIVGIILSAAGRDVPRVYAADLLGAGFGSVAVVPALYLGPPWMLLPLLSAAVLVGAGWCCVHTAWGAKGIMVLPVAGTLVLACYVVLPPVPELHHTKALPMTLAFPDARIEAERAGPLGWIHVVGSSLIREVPGLSLNYGLDRRGGALPEQKTVFQDGDAQSTITRFRGDPVELEHLDFTTMALPYHVRRLREVLVAGAGGGTDVLLALKEKASSITALESNAQVAELMSGPFADFSGHLYSRPEVRLQIREARQFLQGTEERFDLIQLSLLDSFGGSAAGLYSSAENYLYTTEAFGLYLSRLSGSGILAVTRWLKLPPRDSLRVFSTALNALREAGVSRHPEEHLLLIRSWKTSTLLVSRSPFTAGEIEKASAFCDRRSFDVDYYAGIGEERANRYDVQKEALSFRGATSLAGPKPERFLRDYLFDVSPTTDDRPYFSLFFRWDRARTLLQRLRGEFLPFVEIGYVLIFATLVQAGVASVALILLPLLGLRRAGQGAKPRVSFWAVLGMLVYFASIGFAFMFFEMVLLPKYTLLLSHPIYSTAVVLGVVLVFAGCGSLSAGHVESKGLWVAVALVCAWVAILALVEERLFSWALGLPLGARLALTVVPVGALSFFLGWPFPLGLREASTRFPSLVPWVWAVNGCASVLGVVLGKAISLSVGLRMTMLIAAFLYVVAAVVFRSAFSEEGGENLPLCQNNQSLRH